MGQCPLLPAHRRVCLVISSNTVILNHHPYSGQEIAINDVRGRETMDDKIVVRKLRLFLLRHLKIGRVSKTWLRLCTSRGGELALSNNARDEEKPGGKALRCPALYRLTFPRIPPQERAVTGTKDRS